MDYFDSRPITAASSARRSAAPRPLPGDVLHLRLAVSDAGFARHRHALNAAGASVGFVEIESVKGHDAFCSTSPGMFAAAKGFIDAAARARGSRDGLAQPETAGLDDAGVGRSAGAGPPLPRPTTVLRRGSIFS
jgi:hypothetical protein